MADQSSAEHLGELDPDQERARLALRAGPWQLVYVAGQLRYISIGDQEWLRRIYVGVRDQHWNTVPADITGLDAALRDDSFKITFQAHNRSAELDLEWRGTISGDPAGAITYHMRGRALRGFWRNRIGICVLHPEACAGQACRVTHSDGSTEEGLFPALIAPHQPFVDIRAFAHQVAPGAWAEVQFSGEVFEMEDQRNWTDGSFKTYCTPLSLPRPAWVEAGTVIEQSVTIRPPAGLPAEPEPPQPDEVTITLAGQPVHPLPRIGLSLGALAHADPASRDRLAPVLQAVSRLRLGHLRAGVALDRPGWQAELRRIGFWARELDLPVELAVTVSNDAPAELDHLAGAAVILPRVTSWFLFQREASPTSPELIQAARPLLARVAPAALVGGGSQVHFAQLNRQRPPAGIFDVLSYPVSPHSHLEDADTLREALAGLAATVRTARSFAGGARIAVGPVTLPLGTTRPARPGDDESAPPPDPRQAPPLAASWTAITLKSLAESGADFVTLYDIQGPGGVMLAREPGLAMFPVYHLLQAVGEFAGGRVASCSSSRPLCADALHLERGGRHRLLLVNFASTPQAVMLSGAQLPAAHRASARLLRGAESGSLAGDADAGRSAAAGRQILEEGHRLELLPFAVAVLDWDDGGA